MNAPLDYSIEPDVPLIGGWGRCDEDGRQLNNEVCCIRAAPIYILYSAVCTVSFFCFCNSTVLLISLPDMPIFCFFCFPAYCLHLLPLSASLSLPPPSHSYWCGGRCFGPPEGECLWYKKGLMNGSRLFVCLPPSSAAAQALDGTNKSLPVPFCKSAAKARMLHVCGLRLRQMS